MSIQKICLYRWGRVLLLRVCVVVASTGGAGAIYASNHDSGGVENHIPPAQQVQNMQQHSGQETQKNQQNSQPQGITPIPGIRNQPWVNDYQSTASKVVNTYCALVNEVLNSTGIIDTLSSQAVPQNIPQQNPQQGHTGQVPQQPMGKLAP